MGLRSFFGILPPRLPYNDVTEEVEILPVPKTVNLLWCGGSPADVALRVGEEVRTGQDLARNGKGPFLSTVTGRIEDIGPFAGPDGRDYLLVSLSAKPKDLFDETFAAVEDFSGPGPLELREAINRAGFTALSSISNNASIWPAVDTLLVSALDEDLLSTSNQQAFRDGADQAEEAVELLGRATEASRVLLGVPVNLTNLARRLSRGTAAVVMIPPIYPNGLPEILAKKYGAGLLMKNSGTGVVGNTLVVSFEQALAMAQCLKTGKPLLDKIITFSSGKNGLLKNFRVRIGTPASEILKKAETQLLPKGKLILNGAMRGYTCFSDSQPITAATDSVHIQSPPDIFLFEDRACTNCGKCNAICPVNLEVNLLGRFSEYGIFDKCRELGAENCIDCGLCAYVCPARRPLLQLISRAKQVIGTTEIERLTAEDILAIEEREHPHPSIMLFETSPEKDDLRGNKA
jgi:electron transport complex protein RnfC